MTEELGLKGSELQVYAVVHGFSQGEQGCFYGSLQCIADTCGFTRQTAINTLEKLCQKGLLKKREIKENGVKTCQYSIVAGGSKNF